MARTLLNKPNDGTSPGMTVELPNNTGSGSPDSPFLETFVSTSSDNNDTTMQVRCLNYNCNKRGVNMRSNIDYRRFNIFSSSVIIWRYF